MAEDRLRERVDELYANDDIDSNERDSDSYNDKHDYDVDEARNEEHETEEEEENGHHRRRLYHGDGHSQERRDSYKVRNGHGRVDSHEEDNDDMNNSRYSDSFDDTCTTTDTTPSHSDFDQDHEEQDETRGDREGHEQQQGGVGVGVRERATTASRQRSSVASTSRRSHGASPRQHRPRDSHATSSSRISYSALKDLSSTPPSRRTSLRSSRLSTPTTYVPSKKDRLRYSWQSIYDDDEPGKPRIHVIKIVSTASTASAGIGQEEAFGFSCSSGGKRIAVYNSARLFILQTAALPVNVSQEYALKRRPLAVEIVDVENILAVLADPHSINVYDLSHQRVRRVRTIRPDHATYTIALSSTGALLAAAYEGGVEIFSLAESALSTDRRAIRCPRMDKLSFSDDASTLLGTTTRLHAYSTVMVSVPVFPSAANGLPTHDELKQAWCSNLLTPENIRNSSHATFWRDHGHLCNDKIFAWNGLEDTFGILDANQLEYSNIACPIGVSQPLAAVGGLGAAIHSAPSVDETGTSIAMIVNNTTVRIYTMPQHVPDDEQRVEAHSLDHELNDEYGCPFADVRWVHMHKAFAPDVTDEPRTRGRLIVTSPGGMFDSDTAEQTVQDIEGGRIIIFDFDPQYAGQPGQLFTFTLGKAPPQELAEEDLDVAAEVDLVRRRTITKNRPGTLGQKPPSLGRSATSMSRRREDALRDQTRSPFSDQSSSLQNTPTQEYPLSHFFSQFRGSRRGSLSLGSISSEASRSLPDLLEATELAYEEPYTQGAPRSGTAIQRAATIANQHRFQTLEERETEVSDPEGLPLPTYSEMPNQPLPAKYRKLAGLDIPQTGRVLYNPETATAPPVLTHQYHDQFERSYSPTMASPNAATNTNDTRNLYFPHIPTNTHSVSPVTARPPTSALGGWGNMPPVETRLPTTSLQRQSSWETVTTAHRASFQYQSSQDSQSPISPTTTRATLRSQRSFGMRSPSTPGAVNEGLLRHAPFDFGLPSQPAHDSDNRQVQAQYPDTSTIDDVNQFRHTPLDLGDSFRASLIIPNDYARSTFSPNLLTVSDTASTSPTKASPNVYSPSTSSSTVNTNESESTDHTASYYPTSSRPSPFQRVLSTASSSPVSPVTVGPGGVSAGSIPHPITNWYPPAPSAPPFGPPGSSPQQPSSYSFSPSLASTRIPSGSPRSPAIHDIPENGSASGSGSSIRSTHSSDQHAHRRPIGLGLASVGNPQRPNFSYRTWSAPTSRLSTSEVTNEPKTGAAARPGTGTRSSARSASRKDSRPTSRLAIMTSTPDSLSSASFTSTTSAATTATARSGERSVGKHTSTFLRPQRPDLAGKRSLSLQYGRAQGPGGRTFSGGRGGGSVGASSLASGSEINVVGAGGIGSVRGSVGGSVGTGGSEADTGGRSGSGDFKGERGRVYMREEFLEVEGQAKRCVVM